MMRWRWAIVICLGAATAVAGQQAPSGSGSKSGSPSSPAAGSQQAADHDKPSADTGTGNHITPEQAKQLFSLVDELIKFSSQETGLPIKSTVKRQLTTRADVEKYIREKFNEDEGSKRLQQDEIVLKKFGLLDRDFNLKPFLLALLTEQIEAYYDSKTKTVLHAGLG